MQFNTRVTPSDSLRSALKYARQLGAECAGLLASNVLDAVKALEAILRERLALLAYAMIELRIALQKQESTAKAELGKIEPVDQPPFPALQSRWVLAGELLFLAALEAIMAHPALGAFPEFADGGALQWSIAVLVGLLLALIVLSTGKALAYVIKNPSHRRKTSPHWLVWRTVSVLAFLGICCILVLPFFFTAAREDNIAIAGWLADLTQIDQPAWLGGTTETSAPATPEGFQPALGWSLVLQLAALVAGLVAATMFFLGEAYRRFVRLTEAVEEASTRLKELAKSERTKVEQEIAAATFRYHEFFLWYQKSGAAEAGQEIPPVEGKTRPPDPKYWLEVYYSMTEGLEELARREPAEAEGRQDTAPANGSGSKAHVPPPGKPHHE